MSTRTTRLLRRALIVEDDPSLALALFHTVSDRGIEAKAVHTLADGMAALEGCAWDLAIVDVRLPDGNGVDLCRALCLRAPRPVIVALSGASVGKEGFALARLGVGEFLEKPFDDAELWAAIEKNAGVPLEIAAAGSVGTVPLADAQANVRRAMIREALARGKTISETARLLGVTRQAVQQALEVIDDD